MKFIIHQADQNTCQKLNEYIKMQKGRFTDSFWEK
jgi:hypothetical protein